MAPMGTPATPSATASGPGSTAPPGGAPSVRPRIAGRGRPLEDPGCAGCAHLGTLWALRRAGIEPRGAMGCEPAGPPAPASGRFAALAGARDLRASGAGALLARTGEARGGFVLLADRAGARGTDGAATALAAAGARVRAFDPARLDEARDAVAWAAAAGPGAALVALAPCARGAPRAAPLAIAPSRCNRCGACLGLGCPAISDPGEEALAIDPDVCTGCGACAPLCRSRAIAAR
jgi:Pyruvate/2-oxoacid:ferredoxin oxidoreductase delta subunit